VGPRPSDRVPAGLQAEHRRLLANGEFSIGQRESTP
jgi:hypothetical protein